MAGLAKRLEIVPRPRVPARREIDAVMNIRSDRAIASFAQRSLEEDTLPRALPLDRIVDAAVLGVVGAAFVDRGVLGAAAAVAGRAGASELGAEPNGH
jgi:hypothetical protein